MPFVKVNQLTPTNLLLFKRILPLPPSPTTSTVQNRYDFKLLIVILFLFRKGPSSRSAVSVVHHRGNLFYWQMSCYNITSMRKHDQQFKQFHFQKWSHLKVHLQSLSNPNKQNILASFNSSSALSKQVFLSVLIFVLASAF